MDIESCNIVERLLGERSWRIIYSILTSDYSKLPDREAELVARVTDLLVEIFKYVDRGKGIVSYATCRCSLSRIVVYLNCFGILHDVLTPTHDMLRMLSEVIGREVRIEIRITRM